MIGCRLINQQGKKLEDFNRKLLEYDNRQVEMLAEVKNILQAAGVAVPPLSFNGFLSPSESSKAWKKDGEKHTRKASVTLSDDLESHVNGILEGKSSRWTTS